MPVKSAMLAAATAAMALAAAPAPAAADWQVVRAPSGAATYAVQNEEEQNNFPSAIGEMFRMFRSFDDDQPFFSAAQTHEARAAANDLFAPFARLTDSIAAHRAGEGQQQQQREQQQPALVRVRVAEHEDDLVDSVAPLFHGVMGMLQRLADDEPRRPSFAPMPPMFVRLVTGGNDALDDEDEGPAELPPLDGEDEEQQQQQQQQQLADEDGNAPCPFVTACQADVLTLCRDAVRSSAEGAVARCLVENFPLLSDQCGEFVQGRLAEDADAVAEADEGEVGDDADDLDGMAAGLLSCERESDRLCADAVAAADRDPLAIQRCLVERRDELETECRDLVDYMLATADEGAEEAEREAGDAPGAPTDAIPATPTAPAGVDPAEAEKRCHEDAQRLCGRQSRVETLACLHRNAQELSDTCSEALDALPAFHCAEDAARLCGSARGKIGMIKCLHTHADELSDECRGSVVQHRQLRQGGGRTVTEHVTALRDSVRRTVSQAGENPTASLPLIFGGAAMLGLAVAGLRRRKAGLRRERNRQKDRGPADAAGRDGVQLSASRGSLSDARARSRPGVLVPNGAAAFEADTKIQL